MLSRFGLAIILVFLAVPFSAQEIGIEKSEVEDTLQIKTEKASQTEIENWLETNRRDNDDTVFSSAPLNMEKGDLYKNGFFYVGRSNLNMPERNGFETFSSILSPSLYYGNFNSLYPKKEFRRTVNFQNRNYPFAPVLTTVQAGLGDYDHHFVHLNLAKNELLSFSGLEYQGEILAQNGFWTDITSTETSMRHYLSHQGNLLNWEMEYANFRKKVAMYELLPLYWQSTNFPIDYKLQQFYASCGLPWINIKLLNESENANATAFYTKYKRSSTRLQLNLKQEIAFLQYKIKYEHNWQKDDFPFIGYYDAEKYADKIATCLEIDSPVHLDFTADYLDWKRFRLFSEVSYKMQNWEMGIAYKQLTGTDPSPLKVKNIYNANQELDLIDISNRQQASVQFSYNFMNIKPMLDIGIKNITQKADSTWLNVKKQQPFLRLAMEANYTWKNWLITVNPEWIVSKYFQTLTENPEYRFQSVQQIKYLFPYNNAVFAGCSIYGHSGYYTANAANPYLIESSTILDAWAGIDIGKLFELRAGVKNALSSSIYGAYPVPASVFVDVLWLYLN